MRVYDLFLTIQVKKELRESFFDVYLARECSSYLFPQEYDEQAKFISKTREYLYDAFDTILKRTPKADEKNIVIVTKCFDSYENPFDPKFYYDSSVVSASDLLGVLPDKVKLVSNKPGDPGYVETYAYEFCDMDEILGYDVSETCIERWGLLTCAMAIFEELTFNGINSEDRDERKAELEQSFAEAEEMMSDPESFAEKCTPADEVFADIRQKIYDSFNSDEERTYHMIQDKYEDMADAELREIEMRQIEKLSLAYIQQKEDILNAELELLKK